MGTVAAEGVTDLRSLLRGKKATEMDTSEPAPADAEQAPREEEEDEEDIDVEEALNAPGIKDLI